MAWQSAAAGVVGDELASKTRASSIKNGDLTVAVEQDALRHRLLFERDRICGLINELVGRDVVRSIRFGR